MAVETSRTRPRFQRRFRASEIPRRVARTTRARSSYRGGAFMATSVEKTIVVNVPLHTAYNQWTQFEDFPQFMGGVRQVRQLDDRNLHWVAEIAGVRREWDATIL